MGDKTKRNQSRSKKRNPNKENMKRKAAECTESVPQESVGHSSSAKKLCKHLESISNDNNNRSQSHSETDTLGNSLVNMDLLVPFLSEHMHCSECDSGLHVQICNLGGLAQKLEFRCTSCSFSQSLELSKRLTHAGMSGILACDKLVLVLKQEL